MASEPDWFDEFLEAIDDGVRKGLIRVSIWFCPDETHGGKTDAMGWPIPSVEWTDGVAHCLEPHCGRKSTDPEED